MTKAKRTSMRSIRKEEIMNAALTVLSERGSANVTLDDIANASGFSKGGITYYYASKEALIRDVFEQFFEYIWERSESLIRMNISPLEKLEAFVWLYDQKDDQVNKIYPLLFDILVLATYNDEYRKAFQKWVHRWVKITVSMVEEGKTSGDFKVDDVQATAQLIAATAQGIGIRWYLDRDIHTTEWAVEAFRTAVHAILQVEKTQVTNN
jgi:AcrR family transcriptional regulator